MKLNQYQRHARETAIYPEQDALIYTVLGLTGESGEIAEKVKKLLRDNKSLDMTEDVRNELILELGDVLWYVANLAHELGETLEDIAVANIQKLESRKMRGVLSGSGDNR
tara:strand:+ start:937 stop:1266 length:330 start_codon:yes stop_codon:yes gene_type:complete